MGVFVFFVSDVENIPVKKLVAVAGKNLTLPCPGVNEQSLIDSLTWKTTQTIAEFINGMPLVQNERVSIKMFCCCLFLCFVSLLRE